MNNWLSLLLTFFAIQYFGTLCWNLYCHRFLAHRHYDLHPCVQHAMRFFIWLIIGTVKGKEWRRVYAAQHRKHHMYSDTSEDPFSPHHYKLTQLLIDNPNAKSGDAYYMSEQETNKLAKDIKLDYSFIEDKVYSNKNTGKILLTILFYTGFGIPGLILGLVNLLFSSAYLGLQLVYFVHVWGEKNPNRKDHSTNNFPLGFFMGGEELHANHHTNPANPNNARKWYEIDMTFQFAKLLSFLRLLKFRQATV